MPVNFTSFQLSAAYGSSSSWSKSTSGKEVEKAVQSGSMVKVDTLQASESDWTSLWNIGETETVNDDGTITKSVSGGANFIRLGTDQNGYACKGTVFFDVSVTFDPSSYESGQLGETIDLLAAAHEVTKAALRDAFSGAELARKSLEAGGLYAAKKEEAAKSFAEMVGTPMEEQGHAGEKEKIYQSVKAIFASFEAKYQAVAASVSKDSWMDGDLMTAAMKLRQLSVSFQTGSGRTEGLYTLRELEFSAIGVRGGLNLKA